MKKLFVLISLTALLSLSALAQNAINTYFVHQKGFNKPIILDSVNNKGEKFSAESSFHYPKWKEEYKKTVCRADDDGFLTMQSDNVAAKDYVVADYFFEINLQSHETVKFDVFSNAKLKVSIDGNKEKEKLTCEDSVTQSTKISIEKELEPGRHIIGISMLCQYLPQGSNDNQFSYKLKTVIGNSDSANEFQSGGKSGLTLKTMLCGENPYHLSLSSSGDFYMIKYYNTDTQGKTTYRTEIRETESDKIVFKDDKRTSYTWMPKSNLLYFLENSNIYTLNPVANEKKLKIDNLPDNSDVSFFEDEENYIISTTVKRDNTKDDLHRMYLPDDRIAGWRDRTSLSWGFDGNVQPLFHTFRSTDLNDISTLQPEILFSMSRDSITKRPFVFNSIYSYNLQTHSLDTLVQDDGFVVSAQYLQDGEHVVILASNEAFNSLGSVLKKNAVSNAFNQSIYIMNVKTKEVKPVGKYFYPSVSKIQVRKGNIYLKCQNRDSVSLYRYNIKDGTFTMIDLGVDIVGVFDVSKDEKTIVYYGENYNKPKRVFRFTDNKVTEVFFPKQEQFSELSIGKMENFTFKMHNSDIDGRIYYPADFDSAKKYPMVVYYYGGCEPTDRSFEMRYSAWLFTQQGYVVYVINPSGTVGWGQEFAARHVNAWGDYTAEEIIEGVKQVCKQRKFIDKDRIGCIGASYGGFMTQYLQTKTDIFACAISHAGISNITSYWGEGYWGYSYSGAATADNYPWNNPALYTKHSPLFNADKINTPLLLLHGTADTNVPIGESIQMYNALKILGKEVEFITVKGENHGIVNFEKRLKWNNTIFAWFAKWLKGDSSWWDSMYPAEKL